MDSGCDHFWSIWRVITDHVPGWQPREAYEKERECLFCGRTVRVIETTIRVGETG